MDDATGRPEWAAVKTGLFSHRVTFVPLSKARLHGQRVQVPYRQGHIHEAPNIEPHGSLTAEEEARLYQHYGPEYGPVASGADSEFVIPATEGEDEAAPVGAPRATGPACAGTWPTSSRPDAPPAPHGSARLAVVGGLVVAVVALGQEGDLDPLLGPALLGPGQRGQHPAVRLGQRWLEQAARPQPPGQDDVDLGRAPPAGCSVQPAEQDEHSGEHPVEQVGPLQLVVHQLHAHRLEHAPAEGPHGRARQQPPPAQPRPGQELEHHQQQQQVQQQRPGQQVEPAEQARSGDPQLGQDGGRHHLAGHQQQGGQALASRSQKLGRWRRGTFQMSFMASWKLWVMPRPPHRVPRMPTTRAMPEPRMVEMLSSTWGPSTGNCLARVSITPCWSCGSLARA